MQRLCHKNITFKGISAHAGGSPENGRNALYAATCALNSVNALRETFTDNDHIRFHPIITEAGLAVNAIPETAKVESYVRGASFDAIRKYNTKVNQALAASAAAIGCNVELDDHPGYFPLNNDKNMAAVMKEAMETVAGPDSVVEGGWGTGSTDMGDVSAIMPVLHPHANGSIGTGHGKDYYVQDKKLGCLYPAECLVLTAAKLLADDAALERKSSRKQNHISSQKKSILPPSMRSRWIRMLLYTTRTVRSLLTLQNRFQPVLSNIYSAFICVKFTERTGDLV